KTLIATLRKSSPEVQESILNFLAKEASANDVPAIEKSLGNVQHTRAKIAALNTLSKLSNDANTDYLIGEIAQADALTTEAIKSLLLSSKNPTVVESINKSVAGSDVKTQLVLLELLSQRTNAQTSQVVLPLLSSADNNVKTAALKALPNVVNAADYDALVKLLPEASE